MRAILPRINPLMIHLFKHVVVSAQFLLSITMISITIYVFTIFHDKS